MDFNTIRCEIVPMQGSHLDEATEIMRRGQVRNSWAAWYQNYQKFY